MIVYLVRHGVAEDWSEGGRDRDRRLTDRGRRRLEQSARGLQKLGVRPQLILTSPFPRAAETAAILAHHLGVDNLHAVEHLQSGGGGEHYARRLLDAEHAEVMLVGHQPEMSLIAGELCGQGTQIVFKKGGICRIDMRGPDAQGSLIWLLQPKILIELGKSY